MGQMNITNQQYAVDRKNKYPSVEAQLDMLYWDKKNGTNTWLEAIDAVKAEFLKPPVQDETNTNV